MYHVTKHGFRCLVLLIMRFSNDVHAMTRMMSSSESTIVEPLRSAVVVLHDDDDGVVVDGLGHGRVLGLPCELGISLPCGQYGACQLEP